MFVKCIESIQRNSFLITFLIKTRKVILDIINNDTLYIYIVHMNYACVFNREYGQFHIGY